MRGSTQWFDMWSTKTIASPFSPPCLLVDLNQLWRCIPPPTAPEYMDVVLFKSMKAICALCYWVYSCTVQYILCIPSLLHVTECFDSNFNVTSWREQYTHTALLFIMNVFFLCAAYIIKTFVQQCNATITQHDICFYLIYVLDSTQRTMSPGRGSSQQDLLQCYR